MSATEHLIVTYAGHDERTNSEQAPAVPVAELMDVLDRMISGRLSDRVWITHPLQPFDPRNFRDGELVPGLVWSFDPVAAEGARALVAGPRAAPDFLPHPLDVRDESTIELAALVRFVGHPIREFVRSRLGVSLREVGDELPDGIPVDLDGLEKWAVGDRMLRAVRRHLDVDAWIAGEQARGTLPPGDLGMRLIQDIAPSVDEIAIEASVCQGDRRAQPVSVDIPLSDGRRVVGTVPEVFDELVMLTGYSRLGAKARLQAWVYLLALTNEDPGRRYRSLVIGRNPTSGRTKNGTAWIDPLERTFARTSLERLVALYDAGSCTVPMIFTRTSSAYADGTAGSPKSGTGHLSRVWERQFGSTAPGENEDPSHVLVLGGKLDFAELWARHGDAFRASATHLWGDLLTVEGRSH